MSIQNEKAKDAILGMLDKNNMPIVFIGAGLSRPPYPLWNDLIDFLAERTGYQDRQQLMGDPLEAAQVLFDKAPDAYERAIKELYSADPCEHSMSLFHISRIKFKAFLTTNFDRCIERTFRLAGRKPSGVYSVASRLQSSLCCCQGLFFLHGRVDRDTEQALEIVLAAKEYESAYLGAKGHVATFLFDVFAQNNVIFTGFSFKKYEPLNYVLEAVLKQEVFQASGLKGNWKILLPNDADRDQDFLSRLDRVGVEIINFDRIDSSYIGLDWVWGQVADEFVINESDPLKPSRDPISIPKRGEYNA